jgi:uncharacterized damage-inducible protein DinB
MYRLETVLNSWRSVRQDTAQAVEDMPPAALDFKPLPEVASFREIARHVLDAGHALTGLMLAGVDNYAVPEFRAMLKMHAPPVPEDAGADVLASELRSRLDERLSALSKQPPEFFSRIITRFDGQQLTNLEMLETIKDHELTHRSQLFLYLRFNGIVPVTTRRRESKK